MDDTQDDTHAHPECDLCTARARYILIDLMGAQLAICQDCAALVRAWRSTLN